MVSHDVIREMPGYPEARLSIEQARIEYMELHPIERGYQFDSNGEFTRQHEENFFRNWLNLQERGLSIPARLSPLDTTDIIRTMEAYQDKLPEIDKARAEYTQQHPIQGGYQIDINGEFTSRAEENLFRTSLKDEGFDIPARLNDTLPA